MLYQAEVLTAEAQPALTYLKDCMMGQFNFSVKAQAVSYSGIDSLKMRTHISSRAIFNRCATEFLKTCNT